MLSPKVVRGYLKEMGLVEVANYVSKHSTAKDRDRRLRMLYQLAARGEVFEYREEKTIPLQQEYKHTLIERLDRRGLWT
jgi:hypothetical protein